MTAIFLICGLRRSEVAGLALDAIDLDAGEIEVKRVVVEDKKRQLHVRHPKTDAGRRKMKIPPELVSLIRAQIVRVKELMLKWGAEYQREPLFLFPGLAGAPIKPAIISRRMTKLLKLAGIKGAQPCHGWRHTAATVMLHAGHNIKTVQTRLGHSTPAITLALYVHPDEEQDAAAAAHLGGLLDSQG
jgi:integrase